jgi:CheY-like chemotaxis protein
METTPKAKILFVDDDTFIVDVYSKKLTSAGYDVHCATSIKDALDDLRKGFVPDVIMLDLVMSNGSGLDFLDELNTTGLAQNAYRIVFTNQSDHLDQVQAETRHVDRYIVKVTMVPEEVLGVVDQVVASRKMEQKHI